jgi:hypothetical protein
MIKPDEQSAPPGKCALSNRDSESVGHIRTDESRLKYCMAKATADSLNPFCV